TCISWSPARGESRPWWPCRGVIHAANGRHCDGLIPEAESPDSLGLAESANLRIATPGNDWRGVRGMGKAIEITRLDRSAAELRELATKTRDGAVVRRLLGIALLLDGWSRGEAASASGMDRQTLCDWVHRYNAADVAGLATGARSGRPPALSEAQMAELKEMVIKGPVQIPQILGRQPQRQGGSVLPHVGGGAGFRDRDDVSAPYGPGESDRNGVAFMP